ncbi:hypothetical protein [Verrucomicrobium sp. BvORR034]|uniref:hypothetical protein n=1 Tax=Verrucomicrobium sp. BvORR034 TaxID=1396418 RepID=UPI000678E189|nr:hypothetical protein [Verrucomicrobium sp. BvORR034]
MKESLLHRIFQYVCGGLLAAGMLLFIPGVVVPLILFVIRLLFGWTLHAAQAIASIVPTWQGFTAGSATLLATLGALHLLLRMFTRRSDAGTRPWKLRWSASIMSMLLILFATTCASVGILHHAVWLLKNDCFRSRVDRNLLMAKVGGNHLAQHLRAYAEAHGGNYPPKLQDLVTAGTVEPSEFNRLIQVQPAGEVPQTWIYLPAGAASDAADLPLLLSPTPVSGSVHIMITRDGSASEINPAASEAALQRRREASGSTQ